MKRWPILVVAVVLAAIAVGAARRWWQHREARLPSGIVWGNGRIEADEIDIDTKFAGRIAELYVNEGDMVRTGQTVARMDTRDLQASLHNAEAEVEVADKALDQSLAELASQRTQAALARKELDRVSALVEKEYVTKEEFDQRQQALEVARAALTAAQAKVGQARAARDAARHVVELDRVNIGDDSLVAPRDGRIQYRIANVGEVLPAGGKVFTMLDAASVYMDIFLPTADAGRIRIGSDARIVLDAYPQFPVAAYVSYIASQAQFTPKAVETKSERDKLMFRVKVRVDSALLAHHLEAVRTGLPGEAYVRVDTTVPWPARLQSRPIP